MEGQAFEGFEGVLLGKALPKGIVTKYTNF